MIYSKNSMEKTAIIALGGNALSNKSQAGSIKNQISNTRKSLTEIIKFLKPILFFSKSSSNHSS